MVIFTTVSAATYTYPVNKNKETIKNIYIERVGEDTYQKEMDIIKNTKDKVVEKTTPVISDVKDKAKDTYTKAKDKLDEWYKNFKESSE